MAIGTIVSALSLLNNAAPLLGKVAGKFLDGKATREELDHEANKHALDAETLLALEQIRTNRQEAAHPSIFVAGWRPFVGWTSAISFFLVVILFPLLQYAFPDVPAPVLDTELVMTILGGMLGLGGLRTYEKAKGKARDNLSKY